MATERVVSVRLALKNDGFVSGMRQARKEVSGLSDDLTKGARKHKADLDEVARVSAGVGLAAAAGVGLAIKKFADFDKAMSNVKAATHETAGNMAALRDAALEAGAKTAFSATEAAGAIENLAKAGVSTRDILNGGLNGALDLAAAGELDVAQAAETAATAMTQFKLSGSDVPHIADLLAAAAGKAQGEVSDMAAALNQSGLVASQMGLSIEETTGTLAAFASAGLIGSDAGTSFKTMLLRLANPAGDAAEAMSELGINAYDAQGAFIGIAPLAEQLQSKLKGMSQQQRDAALATIFGSDAIRAAAVLYENGAKGITDWTTKVNDAGFAAETAAIKQDNLRGDIEKLGGSFETALIKSGSGANTTLRKLTQTVGAAVDGFSALPDEVQTGATALAAIVAASGLSAAGLIKAGQAAADLKTSWTNLGRTGRTLTLSMGAVGVALAAAAVVYGIFSKKNQEAEQRVETFRGTLDEQTGAITKNTRAYVANELASTGFADKAKGLGLNLSSVTDAVLGNRTELDRLVGSLDTVIEAGTRHVVAGNRAATMLTAEAQAAKSVKDELLAQSGALGEAQRQSNLAAEGAAENSSAQQSLAEAVRKANVPIVQQKQDLNDIVDAMHAASGAALSLSGAQIAFQAAIDDAADSVKEHGRTLDLNTEKGRSNRAALNEVAKSANDQTDALLRSGGSFASASKNAEGARKTFVTVATRMGLNKTAAEKLAQSLIDIPKDVNTNVKNNAPAAKAKVVDYRTNGLNNLPKNVSTGVSVTGIPRASQNLTDFARDADRTLRSIKDQAIRVTLGYASSLGGGRLGRNPEGFHDGGPVTGGVPGKDSVHGLLMPGEHVLDTGDVQKMGGQSGVYAFRKNLHRFANGGAVGVRVNTAVPSDDTIAGVAASVTRRVAADLAKVQGGPSGPPGRAQQFRGVTLNTRTINMLLSAERVLGRAFHITQGSYSTRVAASGSTHSGGGAMDTNGPGGWNAAVSALRRAGFASWHRTPSQGPWGHHIHSIAIGDSSASASAKRQVRDFQRGGDGLGGMAKGGAVLPVQTLDSGGWLPLGPSIAINNTGRPERVPNPRDGTQERIAREKSIERAVGNVLGRGVRLRDTRGNAYVLSVTNA
jgi:TP901 family phage tail tape measure protein